MSLIYQNRVLALAGLFQSIHLVVNAAKSGMVGQDSLERSLNCIFVQNPDSISDVYNGTHDIKLGLSIVGDVLRKFDPSTHGELMRYSLAVMALERSLSHKPDVLETLGGLIETLDQDRRLDPDHFTHDQLVSRLAKTYQSTISKIEPRIKINGSQQHLRAQDNIDRIRALLLSALRSAVLWRQLGGRRWQLLFARGSFKSALAQLV